MQQQKASVDSGMGTSLQSRGNTQTNPKSKETTFVKEETMLSDLGKNNMTSIRKEATIAL